MRCGFYISRHGGHKKKDIDNLTAFVRRRLDYPEFECTHCERVWQDFGTEPACETCPIDLITDANYEIWELYQKFINTQFVYDFQALPLVFEVLNIQCTRHEAFTMLEKLITIHDMVTQKNREK